MWLKILAVLCVPVVVVLALSIPYALSGSLSRLPAHSSAGYKAGYLFGVFLAFAVTALVVLLLSRWIFRTFRKRGQGVGA